MWILWLLIIFLALLAVIGIFDVTHDLVRFFHKKTAGWYYAKFRPLPKAYRAILRSDFDYYGQLPATEKQKFERRLIRFIYTKQFVSRGVGQVTDQMVVLISSVAIKLTMGLPAVYLANFDRILIYPDAYYSNISKKYHLGEVNPRMGIIVLSWKNFMHVYTDNGDARNLGIHEMAHALHFENRIRNQEYGFLDQRQLDILARITREEMAKINEGARHFLRVYAGKNEYEFFAVALESFFEQPEGMRHYLPELYRTLKNLLNQDPLR